MGGLDANHGEKTGQREQNPADFDNLLKASSELAKPLFDQLDQQTQWAKQQIDDLITAHQEPLDKISKKIKDERQKFDNKNELQKLTGKEDIDENQRFFKIEYKGKEVNLYVNELFQINSVEIVGQRINFKTPLKPEYFPRFFSNSQNVLIYLRDCDLQMPPGAPLTADGTARFSFMIGSDEFMVIGDNDIYNVKLYKIDEKISAQEEQEMASLKKDADALKLKIKRDIIKERRLGHPVFNLDDAISVPPNLFPKRFQPDLRRLSTLLLRIGGLEKKAKTTTMTVGLTDRKVIMENLGDDSFQTKYNPKEGVDLLETDHDCDSEALFERGLMVSKRDYSSMGIMAEETELLPNGKIKVTSTFTHLYAENYGKEWKPGDVETRDIRIYDQDRNQLSKVSYDNGRVDTETRYQGGKIAEVVHFTVDSQRPAYKRIEGEKPHRFTFMGRDGKEYRDYNTEHRKDPTLTPGQYIAKLATVFDSPAAWENFSKVFMQYVYDSQDPLHPFVPGTKEKHGDYWQTPEETVLRVNESGQALGDCDDFAFLAQAVLAEQGIKAQVIGLPKHALCAWIKRRTDGKFDAYSICTFGYDKNGHRFDSQSMSQPEEDAGYKTPTEALNSIFVKYEERGLGVDQGIHYRVNDGKVMALSIPKKGERDTRMIPVNDLVI